MAKIVMALASNAAHFGWVDGEWAPVEGPSDDYTSISLRPMSGLELIKWQGESGGDGVVAAAAAIRLCVCSIDGDEKADVGAWVESLPMEPLNALGELWVTVQHGPLAGGHSGSSPQPDGEQ